METSALARWRDSRPPPAGSHRSHFRSQRMTKRERALASGTPAGPCRSTSRRWPRRCRAQWWLCRGGWEALRPRRWRCRSGCAQTFLPPRISERRKIGGRHYPPRLDRHQAAHSETHQEEKMHPESPTLFTGLVTFGECQGKTSKIAPKQKKKLQNKHNKTPNVVYISYRVLS